MISIYKATGSTSSLQQFQVTRFRKEYDLADLALKVIRERGSITRPQFMRLYYQFRELDPTYTYANSTISGAWTRVSRVMEQQGLIEIIDETLSQYLTGGRLTNNQILNCETLLTNSGIFKKHGKNNKGLYSREEEEVFGKIGKYVSDGIGSVEAIRLAVNDVLGEEKTAQFNEWYKNNSKEMAIRESASRREKRAGELREDTSRVRYITDYDTIMGFYDGEESKTHEVILDKLVQDYSKQYPEATKNYPFGLYFALSPNESEAVLRRKFNDLMQSTPTQARFAGYEGTVFGSVKESLEAISTRIVKYLDRGFEESVNQVRTLEDQIEDLQEPAKNRTKNEIDRMKHQLEIVRTLYKDSGTLRTLEEVGREYGVTKERIRQLKDEGLNLLRRQPTIQELLSLDFLEI